MLKPAADSWALEVLHQVEQHLPFESAHVELKAELVEPQKFAPQFAGLANAARWHPVMVIFGVHQQNGIIGINPFEVGAWYRSLRACFEYAEAPVLAYQNFLAVGEKTIGVLVFDTDSPPYILVNSTQRERREIRWRFGTDTGWAGRRELLSILLQKVNDPELDILEAELRVGDINTWRVSVDMYIYPAAGQTELVIPFHRISVSVTDKNGIIQALPSSVSLKPVSDSSRATVVDAAVAIPAVSKLRLSASHDQPSRLSLDSDVMEIAFAMQPAHFAAPTRHSIILRRRNHPDYRAYWQLEQQLSQPLQTAADTMKVLEVMAQCHRDDSDTDIPFANLAPRL